MSSILKVSEIQDPTNGNTALTINSSGEIHSSGSVVQCQLQTRTIGNTGTDADITTQTLTTTPGLADATAINTVSITPKFSDSKILMQWSGMLHMNGSAGQGADVFFTKDDSNLLTSGGNRDSVAFLYKGSGATFELYGMHSAQLSFTSGQTTSMTLKVEINRYNTTGAIALKHDGTTTLTVWEIAQ